MGEVIRVACSSYCQSDGSFQGRPGDRRRDSVAHGDAVKDNCAAGMAPQEARRNALLRFGTPAAIRERVAEADAALRLDRFGADVRNAFRQLRRSPCFACTAILILALGLGACTACLERHALFRLAEWYRLIR
jgi:hypothetical protein